MNGYVFDLLAMTKSSVVRTARFRKPKEDMQLFTKFKKGMAAAVIGLALLSHAGAASAATLYKATDNDTFWSMSKRFNVNIDGLMKANPTVNPLNIYAGLTIVIPDGGATAPAAPQAKETSVKSAKMSMMAVETAAAAAPSSDTLTVSGQPIAYSDSFQVKASAYTAAASENGGYGAVDYFGNALKVGTIAVDPERIPLGTKVYVTGYDYNGLPQGGMYAIASDTGGAIKGNRIDIFVPSSQQEARTFGYQYVTVYVLK
ncbi:3D (Asp-Asp-Asp) domain-containing protein [Paenibacillus phyllosphaerae]|uniref:3D (Asp-Asp-Asp) domain-containing protein n=1 Tax=Paenibacillus phyllosphaerae TaxID=274593 RepID=A0A7W5ATS5_9BACL|nr:3D domain-containing protein [Paenibacillus phyllosphaerae]MBB3108467.1 3D (Asp-Asp-Asp) domain-containing protein [Paenibacillus phyllosphaerae]